MLNNLLKRTWPLALLLVLSFAGAPPKKIKLYLIGDSTIAQKIKQTYPETGWGMPLYTFFDSTVVVDNRAQNGRSTRTFMAENRWQPIVDALQEGDYVFIQFGHNDEVATKANYTPEADFRANLLRFVLESRAKKATPVLLTPVARRKFDASGKIEETHAVYAAIVRSLAQEQKVPLIDLDAESQVLLQQFGVENSKLLFNQLLPGEHPNYPAGKEDNTHFNELGARKMAQLAVSQVMAQKLPILSEHLAKPTAKNAVPPATNPNGKDAQPTTP